MEKEDIEALKQSEVMMVLDPEVLARKYVNEQLQKKNKNRVIYNAAKMSTNCEVGRDLFIDNYHRHVKRLRPWL